MDITPALLLDNLTRWVTEYPAWTGIIIFTIAMLESLVIIGIIVPGAMMMIIIGALIALGVLELWSSLGWAIAGAITGDGLSFWLGYTYRDHLRSIWPFSRYAHLISKGEEFFLKHGGKSIILGRFAGPLRAIVPTIAGMMVMSPYRYLTINVLSAIAWAPVYMLPGILFGASLELASEIAVRFAILIIGLLGILLITRWLVGHLFSYMQPRTERIFTRVLNWSRKHPVLGKVTGALVDPRYPESTALIFLASMLLLTGFLFFAILLNITNSIAPGGLDNTAHNLMQSLRTPWMDSLMVGITMLGDTLVYTSLSLVILVWLLWKRNMPATIHWVAAIAFGGIMTRILKVSLQIPRPNDLATGATSFSFPSAHTTMSMVVYGFLAVLVARELGPRGRRIIYVGSSLLIISIAFSRLYLGVHWVTDIVGGLTLGFVWVSLLGIAYRRHASPPLPATSFVAIGILTLAAVAIPHISLNHAHEMQQYERHYPEKLVEGTQWWESKWKQLPVYRNDLGVTDHHPMNLQWSGSITALQNELKQHGWIESKTLGPGSMLQWLNPKASLNELPVLPQVHEGRHQDLLLVHPANTADKQWVMRLWKTNITLTPSQQTLWIGNVSTQAIQHAMGILKYPATNRDFDTPLSILAKHLEAFQKTERYRITKQTPGFVEWAGGVLIIKER